jgi:ABC-type branched-subunit amino acid transport system substrate-binding protein
LRVPRPIASCLPGLRRRALAACVLPLVLGLAACGAPRVAGPAVAPQAAAPAEPASAPPQQIAPTVETLAAPALPAGPSDRIRVALLLPLSGPNATLGHALLDAAQLAVFDVADEHFELLPRDTGGTADGAARAATAALNDGARLILGPLLAPAVEAVKPVAQSAGVNVIAFSTSIQLAGNGTYLLSFLPRQEVRRVVDLAHAKGATRFAALAPSTPYGQLVVEELRAAATADGGELTKVQYYDPAATDLTAAARALANFDARRAALEAQRKQLAAAGDDASRQALQRLANRETAGDVPFDAVMIPEGGTKLKAVASLLPYYDIDPAKVRFLGTGLWDQPGLGNEPALVGGWFAAPPPEARADFEKRFQALYKHKPPRLATLGYDAAALAALLARDGTGDPFAAAALTNPSGFAGVDGIFRFLPDGESQRGLAVLAVTRDGTEVVSPAPQTFENIGY